MISQMCTSVSQLLRQLHYRISFDHSGTYKCQAGTILQANKHLQVSAALLSLLNKLPPWPPLRRSLASECTSAHSTGHTVEWAKERGKKRKESATVRCCERSFAFNVMCTSEWSAGCQRKRISQWEWERVSQSVSETALDCSENKHCSEVAIL